MTDKIEAGADLVWTITSIKDHSEWIDILNWGCVRPSVFFNNFNFFFSQETVNVLRFVFSGIRLSICIEIFLQNLGKTKSRRHF